MIEAVAGLAVAGGGVLASLERATAPRRATRARVRALAGAGAPPDHHAVQVASPARVRLVEPLLRGLVAVTLRLSSYASPDDLRQRLYRGDVDITPRTFLVVKAVLALLAYTIAVRTVALHGAAALVWPLVLVPTAFLAPDSWLTMRQRARRHRIDRSLPDMLDLLTVSVEAGLAFDAAALKVSERLDGPFSNELSLMLRELRLGSSRRQALTNMEARCGSDEVASFVRALLQSDELGSSLGGTLRVHAAELRERRRLAAEEQAIKAPVKMLFPTVAFIFPAIFVVTLGPAMLNLMHMFNGDG